MLKMTVFTEVGKTENVHINQGFRKEGKGGYIEPHSVGKVRFSSQVF